MAIVGKCADIYIGEKSGFFGNKTQKPGFFCENHNYLWKATKKPGFFFLATNPETGFLFGILKVIFRFHHRNPVS